MADGASGAGGTCRGRSVLRRAVTVISPVQHGRKLLAALTISCK